MQNLPFLASEADHGILRTPHMRNLPPSDSDRAGWQLMHVRAGYSSGSPTRRTS